MNVNVGFAMCGSFCTFSEVISQMENLVHLGCQVFPIMSKMASNTDTRFGTSKEHKDKIKKICGRDIIEDITSAEPLGPQKIIDVLIIAPCTGNTLGKLAAGITDTSITMASKAHLRNQKPLVIAVSTNDGLSGSAKNIGLLLNQKNVFFVPMSQDDAVAKPTSLIADFTKIPDTIKEALSYKQIQPVYI